jgi:predicted transcriptional regulator
MDVQESISIMKALADSSRLMILNSLFEKPQYVEEISKRINLAVSTVSFHLKKMEEAGLVSKSKQQYYIIYEINKEIFNKTLEQFVRFDNIEKYAQEERIEEYKQKIIKTFFRGKKLFKLPSQNMKRWIVLEVILNKFVKEKEYTEQEVDAIIKSVYDDYCTVRRYFIDEKVMIRQGTIYKLNNVPSSIKDGLKYSFEESIKKKFNKEG